MSQTLHVLGSSSTYVVGCSRLDFSKSLFSPLSISLSYSAAHTTVHFFSISLQGKGDDDSREEEEGLFKNLHFSLSPSLFLYYLRCVCAHGSLSVREGPLVR